MPDLPPEAVCAETWCTSCKLKVTDPAGTEWTVIPHRPYGPGCALGSQPPWRNEYGRLRDRYISEKSPHNGGSVDDLARMLEYVTEPGDIMDTSGSVYDKLFPAPAPSAPQPAQPAAPFPLVYLVALLAMVAESLALNIALPVASVWPHLVLVAFSVPLAVAFARLAGSRQRLKAAQRLLDEAGND